MWERPSRTKAVGPQLQADLQRGLQRVRYLTQLALHSSLPASLSPLIYPFSSLSFMRCTRPSHYLSLSPLFAPFPLIFAPKACLVVPIPEFSKKVKKAKSGEGRGQSSKRGNQRRIDANEKRGKERLRGFGWWGGGC